jgi:hypothetical protein
MTDLLSEIKEQDREEKTNQRLKFATLGLFILGITLVIFLGFNSWYNNKIREEEEADGLALTQLVNRINRNKEGKKEEAIAKLELLGKKTNAFGALANFYLASLSFLEGKSNKAIYYYQRVAEGSYDKFFKDYAYLVLLNTKLKFAPELSEDIKKELTEKLPEQKAFRESFLLLNISLTGKKEGLEELKNYKNNDPLTFITNLLNEKLNSTN